MYRQLETYLIALILQTKYWHLATMAPLLPQSTGGVGGGGKAGSVINQHLTGVFGERNDPKINWDNTLGGYYILYIYIHIYLLQICLVCLSGCLCLTN